MTHDSTHKNGQAAALPVDKRTTALSTKTGPNIMSGVIRPNFHVANALASLNDGDYEGATAKLRLAVEFQRANIEAWGNRDDGDPIFGEYNDVLHRLAKTISSDLSDASSICLRARLLTRLGDPEAARRDAAEVIRLLPQCPWGYFERGLALERMGAVKSATADYRQYLALLKCTDRTAVDRGAKAPSASNQTERKTHRDCYAVGDSSDNVIKTFSHTEAGQREAVFLAESIAESLVLQKLIGCLPIPITVFENIDGEVSEDDFIFREDHPCSPLDFSPGPPFTKYQTKTGVAK